MVSDWIASLVRLWRGLAPAVRIGLGTYGAVLIVLAVAIGLRHGRRVEIKQAAPVQIPAAPIATAPAPIEIVIDSVDKAAFADAISDDNSTSVSMSSKVSEQEMMRVVNNWLQPQIMQLKKQSAET